MFTFKLENVFFYGTSVELRYFGDCFKGAQPSIETCAISGQQLSGTELALVDLLEKLRRLIGVSLLPFVGAV